MKIGVKGFRGMAPRIAPQELPPNGAQLAINARLQSGDLEAWRQFLEIERLAISPRTIYLLEDQWLAWTTDVDVARAPIPGDDSLRVYLTGPEVYDQPRWTDYSLAFQSPGDTPPVVTRPLGVPAHGSAPTLLVGVDTSSTSFSIDILDEGGALATDWVISAPGDGAGTYARVEQDATIGNPAPSYKLTYDENYTERQQAYAYKSFGLAGTSVMEGSVDFIISGDASIQQAILILGADVVGAGVMVYLDAGYLNIAASSRWAYFNSVLGSQAWAGVLTADVAYSMTATATLNDDGTQTVVASLYDAGDVLICTTTATLNVARGDYVGIVNGRGNDAATRYITYYDNIHIRASGATSVAVVNVATSYVFTLVNDIGEESAPSPPSATILRPDGVSVTVTTPIAPPTGISIDYGLETKRIYRAVTGATGSIFRFVAEIPISQADYVDTLTDAQLGEALESEGWDLPPDDLQGILALPNGIMVGFRRNQLCLSAQNRPHAWPPAYRLNTDTDIVGIGAIDTAVVIGTKTFPYVAQGQTPADYAAAKLEVPQACTSKRSIAYLSGVGVCMATPDGYMAIVGVAQPINLTRSIFTRKQWQALDPTTIVGVAHDDVLHFFWGDEDGGGYALDGKQDGFGLIQLAYHAAAVHADPVTDNLYLALDANDEPTAPYLPDPGSPVVPDGRTIYQFDGHASELMNYQWRGRLNLLEQPMSPQWQRVLAADFDNIIARGYMDGNQQFAKVVESNREFRSSRGGIVAEVSYEQEIIGTSRVRGMISAEDIDELGG